MFLKHQSNRSITRPSEGGFSLITIAIALAVIGLLLVPMIRMYDVAMKAERVSRNKTSSSLASAAVTKYFLLHGHYPTPAAPGNALGSAAFGHSVAQPSFPAVWPSCQNPITSDGVVCSTVLNTLSGGQVLIGVLPFADLNIPFSSVLDANKNLMTYAVTANLTIPSSYTESGGQIIVQNSAGNPIYASGARSHFVIVGHGDDSKGAYALNGIRNIACDINSRDFENCNKDGRFRSNIIANTVDVQINDSPGATHFDDYVQEKNSSATGMWSYLPNPLSTTDLSINDRMGGNVASGNCDGRSPCVPVSRFDIYGNGLNTDIPAARAKKVEVIRFCGRGNASGDLPGTGSWGCVSDYGLASNSTSTDTQLTTCLSGTCPPVGATWDGTTNLPPWFTPWLILGIPPTLTETSPYWLATAGNHTSFHRGNGILCVGGRALNGIFDKDESCNNTSYVATPTKTTLSACGTGEYAVGLKSNNSFLCKTSAGNI